MNTNVEQAYNKWSAIYDTNVNKTRDAEAVALRDILSQINDASILEIGCGTGKNSEWLVTRATRLLGVDLSQEMLARARAKVDVEKAEFIRADITKEWVFAENNAFDLIVFSLVLEHIKDIHFIFQQAALKLRSHGTVYVGELHPFKQYSGSKARFETEEGLQIVDCFTHHVSDFISSAEMNGLVLQELRESFDEDDRSQLPRILNLVFTKPW